MLCADMMDQIMRNYSCHAKWLVYIDVDVFIYDFTIPLETYIQQSYDVYTANSSQPCSIVGQDGPTTINAGFFFVRFSPVGYQFIRHWRNYEHHHFQLQVSSLPSLVAEQLCHPSPTYLCK